MSRPRTKKLLRLLLPPIFLAILRKLRSRSTRPEWEYVPSGWRAALEDPAIKGWAQASVLKAYVSRWPEFVAGLKGTLPFGVSPEALEQDRANLAAHNVIMSYAYALDLAAVKQSSLSLLDWGGGIGHYYLISKALRPDLEIDYSCKDFEVFTAHGQTLFPEAHFYAGDDWKGATYDFVLASSSLQYSEDWRLTLAELAQVATGYLFITRLPVIQHHPSYVMVQRPYQYGYNTEYLGWCLNRQEVIDCAERSGLTMMREFVIEFPPYIHNAPEQCQYWGFLFKSAEQKT